MFFTIKLEEDCICLFTIYHKHYWMISVQKPHEEVTIGHLENKTKVKVNGNTSETLNVHQKGIGSMNTPSEQNTTNSFNIGVWEHHCIN